MSEQGYLPNILPRGTRVLVWGHHVATVVEDHWDTIEVRWSDGKTDWVLPRKVKVLPNP
jgi:hypothetical protein